MLDTGPGNISASVFYYRQLSSISLLSFKLRQALGGFIQRQSILWDGPQTVTGPGRLK
jgi:hypothetical protein